MNQPCYKCHQLTPHPVMSGAGVDRRALCPTCYTVTRAVAHIDVEAVESSMPLTVRLMAAGVL